MTFTDDMSPYGFIAPTGNYISVGWGEHTEWAFTYLDQNNQYDDFYHSEYDYPVDYLVYDRGFLLLDSPGYGEPMLTASREKPMTHAQRETLYDYYMWWGKEDKARELYKEN